MGEKKRKIKEYARKIGTMTPCLSCGALLDAVTSIDHTHDPEPGAISICRECGHIMIFDDALHLRNPNDAEILEIAGDKKILEMMEMRAAMKLRYDIMKEIAPLFEKYKEQMNIGVKYHRSSANRNMDWAAVDINTWEPGQPIGFGSTKEMAIKNLYRSYAERLLDEALRNRERERYQGLAARASPYHN